MRHKPNFHSATCFTAVLLAVLGVLITVVPADADAPASTQVDWSRHDTAVYVVSTLNLVRTGDGHPLVPLVTDSYGVRRYAVWEDLLTSGYVIQMKRDTGRNVGQLAYKLGWARPTGYSRLTDTLGIPRALPPFEGHFRSHPRRLIGTFTSTLPL